jgi:hypothetical protein
MKITGYFEFVLDLVELAVRILAGHIGIAVRNTVRNLDCFTAVLDTEGFKSYKAARILAFQE